ncbi:outer membrane protein [Aestuariispira insulae]|uniref:Opacity protein-like surface antigen n=1 Tax=Aestuariispira insulae TaxID=1461337 RepID=A0A3D9HP28_9PROT|nr:porin family protein [Aestuariispira insulae]RED51248.1 opacity protein-like surface antigen [Aestuariispira insulae]
MKSVTGLVGAIGLLAAAVLVNTSAFANEGGFYVGLRGIGAFGVNDNFTTSGLNGTLEERNTEDPVAGIGGIFGYRFENAPIRTELELSHRFRMDLDLRDLQSPATGFENNLATTSALINVAFEIRNDTNFTPYIGGTFGWSRNHSDVEREVSGSAPQTFENDNDDLALGVMAGVTWRFAEHWDVDLAYRYINLGEVDTGNMSGDQIKADYHSHDALLTVDYRF